MAWLKNGAFSHSLTVFGLREVLSGSKNSFDFVRDPPP